MSFQVRKYLLARLFTIASLILSPAREAAPSTLFFLVHVLDIQTLIHALSDQYATLDRDLGSTLYYSGSNSHNNTDPHTPHISNNTKALRASLSRRHPVRVLRSGAGTENKYAPSKGIRYDGLYEILSEALEKNAKGGAYVRFELARKSDQENIDSTSPNWKER